MGHRFRVDTGAIDTSGGRVRSGAQAIRGELDRLVGEITGLTGSEWTGQASSAFAAQYQQLNEGWKQVETALESIAQQMRGTADSYSSVEEALSRRAVRT